MPAAKQGNFKASDPMMEQMEKLKEPLNGALEYLRDYAREKPDVAMLWCFGIGFVLGWKLKPW